LSHARTFHSKSLQIPVPSAHGIQHAIGNGVLAEVPGDVEAAHPRTCVNKQDNANKE
jgi:hypothetical protein